MTRPTAALGADLGGTWVRAELIEAGRKPRRVRRRRGGRPPAEVLRGVLSHWGLKRVDALYLGAKGAGGRAAPRRWAHDLRGLARRIRVVGDLELARDAAFAGGPGLLLIAGTGSAALARGPGGRRGRAGGRGPLLGDEGSAFWIGRRLLDAGPDAPALRLARRPDTVERVAALARGVVRRAGKGGAREKAIMKEAVRMLALLARRAAQGVFTGEVPVCFHGGLTSDPAFRAALTRALGRRFRPQEPAGDAASYAARQAALSCELLS